MIRPGMTEVEFAIWKKSWFKRIPKCPEFACCHEMTSCAIDPLCGCGSIYNTYKKQTSPRECTNVDCCDCMKKYDCEKLNHNKVGPYSLVRQFDYLQDFINTMKNKIINRDKYYGYNRSTLDDIKSHFIDEIIETFDLGPSERITIRKILLNATIDKKELVDVANMAWILSYFIENDMHGISDVDTKNNRE